MREEREEREGEREKMRGERGRDYGDMIFSKKGEKNQRSSRKAKVGRRKIVWWYKLTSTCTIQ